MQRQKKLDHYLALWLKFKPEFQTNVKGTITLVNKHNGTRADKIRAYRRLVRLYEKRYAEKTWQGRIYDESNNLLFKKSYYETY